jgi:hypothetical protein
MSGVNDWWVVGGRKSTSTGNIDRNLVGGLTAVKVWDEYISDETIAEEAAETPSGFIARRRGLIRPSPGRHIIVQP